MLTTTFLSSRNNSFGLKVIGLAKTVLRKRGFWLVALGLVLLVFVAFIPFFLRTLITGGCEDFVLSRLSSPSGRLIATVFVRDCGATTSSNTQVLINDGSFFSKLKRQKSFVIFEGDESVKISWLDDNTLKVSIPAGAKVFRQEVKQGQVNIQYE